MNGLALHPGSGFAPKLCLWALVAVGLVLAGCGSSGNGGGSGGITVPETDSTRPELNIGVAEVRPNGPSIVVEPGGPDKSLDLKTKTGTVNLLLTAKDPESGIQETQIWFGKRTTRCDQNLCQGSGDLLGAPRFSTTEPQAKPGETTAASSIHGESFELAQEIPQGSPPPGNSIRVEMQIRAVAVNHLGGRSETAKATLVWTESG